MPDPTLPLELDQVGAAYPKPSGKARPHSPIAAIKRTRRLGHTVRRITAAAKLRKVPGRVRLDAQTRTHAGKVPPAKFVAIPDSNERAMTGATLRDDQNQPIFPRFFVTSSTREQTTQRPLSHPCPNSKHAMPAASTPTPAPPMKAAERRCRLHLPGAFMSFRGLPWRTILWARPCGLPQRQSP
jgi:hypothetical protein